METPGGREGSLNDFVPLISVVVLNWNGLPVIESCLESILRQTYQPLEVIVVDNASEDGSPDLIRNRFPLVRLILNEKNLGFGGGNNLGIKASKGRYIMILNNDTRLDLKCLEFLMQSLERDRRYGAGAPKILLDHQNNLIDAAGIVVYPDGLSIGRGRMEQAEQYDEETEVFCASGCAGLFRREMIEEIGLYDEDFFAYAEDTDLGWRARLTGWKCIYNPQAVVYHLHSSSTGTFSPFKAFLVERNRIWVALKNFPVPLLFAGQAYTLWRYLFNIYLVFTGRGAAGSFTREYSKSQLLKIMIKVYFSVLRRLPLILKKRSELGRRRGLDRKKAYLLLNRFGISTKALTFKE